MLGPVAVLLGGRPQTVGGPRQRAVLAALLLRANQEVRVSQLLEMVWWAPPNSAESNLRTYLSRLHRILRVHGESESRLRSRPGGRRLIVRPGELDLDRFSEHAAQSARVGDRIVAGRHLQQALSMWEGPAMQDVAPGPLLDVEATRLDSQRERVRERLLQLRLDAGRHAELIPELRALLLADPHRESLVAMLMLALQRSGRRVEALDVFRQTRERLVAELGIEPSPDLQHLHSTMLGGAPVGTDRPDPGDRASPLPQEPLWRPTARPADGVSRAAAADSWNPADTAIPAQRPGYDLPHQLPIDVPMFTGRTAELAEILRPADDDPARGLRQIIAIDGMAGVGKTTLAVRAGHLLADRHPEGQLFVDLHGHTHGADPLDPSAALEQLLRGLGVPAQQVPTDMEARSALFRSELAGRRMLVLLDNAYDATQVRPLLPGAGPSRVLITSQRRLTELDQVYPLALDVLPLPDAVALFTRLCPRIADASPSRAQADLVTGIIELCGRLPLAIRITAIRLRDRKAWLLTDLHQRLSDRRRRLTELSAGQDGVSAALGLSYTALAPATRHMLRSLGLHPAADVDLNAAAALAGIEVAESDRILSELVDTNLLRETSANRFKMHSLVQAYVEQQAGSEDRPTREAAVRRLLGFYLHTADAAEQAIHPRRPRVTLQPLDPPVEPLTFSDRTAALRWCDWERPHFIRLARLAVEHGLLGYAWQLPWRLGGYFYIRHGWDDAAALYRIALAAAWRLRDPFGQGEILVSLGFSYTKLRRHEEAIACYRRAIECCREAANPWTEGLAAVALAHEFQRAHRHDEAIAYHRHALAIYRAIDEDPGLDLEQFPQAEASQDVGQLRRTLETFQEAITDNTRIGNMAGTVRALVGLCETYRMLGRYSEAARVAQRALRLCARIDDPESAERARRGLGLASDLDPTGPTLDPASDARTRMRLLVAMSVLEHAGLGAEADQPAGGIDGDTGAVGSADPAAPSDDRAPSVV